MPEGDSIRNFAAALDGLLVGKRLVAAEVRAGDFGFRGERRREVRREPAQALVGRSVLELEVVGKHMMIWFDGGPGLRVHLGLEGGWHAYAHDERWQRPDRLGGLVLVTEERVVVCFRPMHIEWMDRRRRASHPMLTRLGPDLLEVDVDLDEVVARALATPDRPAGTVVMDQEVAAGVGNVVRSEVLFVCGVHPLTPISGVGDTHALFAAAAAMLQANVGTGPRVTTDAATRAEHGARARLWAYGRHGRPCYRCGTAVVVERIGDPPRGCWWCPSCQDAG